MIMRITPKEHKYEISYGYPGKVAFMTVRADNEDHARNIARWQIPYGTAVLSVVLIEKDND